MPPSPELTEHRLAQAERELTLLRARSDEHGTLVGGFSVQLADIRSRLDTQDATQARQERVTTATLADIKADVAAVRELLTGDGGDSPGLAGRLKAVEQSIATYGKALWVGFTALLGVAAKAFASAFGFKG